VKIVGVLLVAVLILAAPAVCRAATVVDAVMCEDVQDREPVGAADSFAADVGKVWCWSKIKDGKGETIKHVYYYGDREMAAIELSVGSALWRTYSSKKILSAWTGQWRIDIVDEEGVTLKSLEFSIVE